MVAFQALLTTIFIASYWEHPGQPPRWAGWFKGTDTGFVSCTLLLSKIASASSRNAFSMLMFVCKGCKYRNYIQQDDGSPWLTSQEN